MNMYLHELKAYRKSTFIWAGSLAALVVLMLAMFPSFSQDIDKFTQILESYPEAVLQAIGVQIDTIGSILGYYSYVFTYILLCGAIQAMVLGTSIVSKEVREKTADFLLAKPVSRTRIMTAKLLAAVSSLLVTNLVFLAAAYLMVSLVEKEETDVEAFLYITLTLLIIQLVFLALGIAASVAVSKMKSVLSVSLGTVFGFFIVSLFSSTIGDEALRYVTPFQFFNSAYVIQHGGYETPYLVEAFVLISTFVAAGYVLYVKKDVHAI